MCELLGKSIDLVRRVQQERLLVSCLLICERTLAFSDRRSLCKHKIDGGFLVETHVCVHYCVCVLVHTRTRHTHAVTCVLMRPSESDTSGRGKTKAREEGGMNNITGGEGRPLASGDRDNRERERAHQKAGKERGMGTTKENKKPH